MPSDPHDFAGLYIRHRSSLILHARRHVRDASDADEVVQEAFLRLFLALPELETELQALAYCRRTITNLCIDRFRAQARRPQLVALDSVPPDELADEDPGDPVVRAEDAAIVRAALSMLSPLHRSALVMREIEEKSLPVIAVALDIPEDSVKHVLFRARRALRKLLAGTSLFPGCDAELPGPFDKMTRVGPAAIAGLFLLLLLGFGNGTDLRAIPVVGVNLPDLMSVTELAKAVGSAVSDVAEAVAGSASDAPGRTGAEPDPAGVRGDGVGPVPAPSRSAAASPSPSATAPVLSPSPAAAPASPVATPAAAGVGPTGAATAEPDSDPDSDPVTDPDSDPSAGPVTDPSADRSDQASGDPSADPALGSEPTPAGDPAPGGTADASADGTSVPSPAATPTWPPTPDSSTSPDHRWQVRTGAGPHRSWWR